MIILAVLIGFAAVVYKLVTVPRPNEPLNEKEFYNYYFNGGWKDYKRLQDINKELAAIEKERAEQEIFNALETLAHLENQKDQLHNIYSLIEYELEREKEPKKRAVLYNKLRTLDNQLFAIDQKIKKILDY